MEKRDFKLAIVKYTDHASLNRIEAGLRNGLEALSEKHGVRFDCTGRVYDGRADMEHMTAIARQLAEEKVDLFLTIATPSTVAVKPIAEAAGIPTVFYAVSDPIGAGVIRSFEHPGPFVTGVSDALDGRLLVEMMLSVQRSLREVGLLYDRSQLSSRGPMEEIKAILAEKGISWVEATPESREQVKGAAKSLIDRGVKAILTPTDNTIMSAELEIYPMLADAGVTQYTGSHAFVINGAFFGLGGSYQSGDRHVAAMVEKILIEGVSPDDIPVAKGSHELATVNAQVCDRLGFDRGRLEAAFGALGAKTVFLDTQEQFDENSD